MSGFTSCRPSLSEGEDASKSDEDRNGVRVAGLIEVELSYSSPINVFQREGKKGRWSGSR